MLLLNYPGAKVFRCVGQRLSKAQFGSMTSNGHFSLR
jgi:hypothetical protein